MIDLSRYEDRFAQISVGQSMRVSWRWMKGILFRPFDVRAFATFGLLGLFSRLGVGSKNIRSSGVMLVPFILLERGPRNEILIAVLIVASIAFLIGWIFAEARMKLIYLNSIAAGRVDFVGFWKAHKKTGASLFWWMLIFYFALIGDVIGLISYFFYKEVSRPAAWPLERMLVPLLFIGSLGIAFLANFFVMRFIFPLMVIKKTRFLDSWRLFRKVYGDNKSYMISYMAASLGVYICVVLAASFLTCVGSWVLSFFMLFVAAPIGDPLAFMLARGLMSVVSILALKIISSFVFQPFQMWYHGWALSFYGGFGGDLNVLAPGEAGPLQQEEQLPEDAS
jgi:hypothetical protein